MQTNENQQVSDFLTNVQGVLEKYQEGNAQLEGLRDKIFSVENQYSQEVLEIGEEIADKIFQELDTQLTPEQRGQLATLTGKERVGAAGRIWGALNAQMVVISNSDGQVYPNVGSVISKVLGNPIGFAAMGNIIYNSIQDFKDGVTASEVFNVVTGTFGSAINGVKFVNSFFEAKFNPKIPGSTYLEKLKNYYFDIGSVNTIKPVQVYSYDIDVDTESLTATRFTKSSVQNVVPTSSTGVTPGNLDGIVGTYKPIDVDFPNIGRATANIDNTFDALANSTDIPSATSGVYKPVSTQAVTPDAPDSDIYSSGKFGKAMSALSIAADVAFLSSQLTDISLTIQRGEKVTAEKILNLVGTVISTVGDVVSLAGPVGSAVGTVISAIGGVVSSTAAFTKLGPDSTPKEIGMAVGDFFSSLIPVIPSARAIDQALQYERLMNSATNEVDRKIYGALHKIAALDATPIINLFHSAYNGEIRDDVRDELIEAFGSFDSMMRDYIRKDTDFSNNLADVAKFLKQNGNTQHTQYITAYLTPEQVKSIFGEEAEYRSGYDVRNVDSSIQVRGAETLNGAYKLTTKEGLEILPVGENLQEQNGRQILDTISLGYGVGNEVEDGKRRIDTSTYVGYTKQALEMFFTEFQRQHSRTETRTYTTTGGGMAGVSGLGAEIITHTEQVVIPQWQTPRVWLDLVDDMSGIRTASETNQIGSLPNVNNRVRAVATDLVYANINTGAGDDDVLFTDILRKYSGGNSIVRAVADGGAGNDILDLSHMTDRAIKDGEIVKDEAFEGVYSINENKLEFNRMTQDGKDYGFSFSNFENFVLTGALNSITVKDGSDVALEDGSIREIKISGENSAANHIALSRVTSAKLIFSGSTDGVNIVSGTDNDDKLTIANTPDSKGNGQIKLLGEKGNDYIVGGEVKILKDENNKLYGGTNELYGGEGQDIIIGRGQNNILDGGTGDDFIFGSGNGTETGTDILGREDIQGREGNDTIEQGGAFNETVYLRDAKTYSIRGGNGDDIVKLKDLKGNNIELVSGEVGNDTLDLSGVRNDRKYGRFNGSSSVIGDVNVEEYTIDMSRGSITFDATSSIGNYRGSIAAFDFENLIGTDISDKIIGNHKDNILQGNKGNDTIFGGGGFDTISGQNGDDTIDGEAGSDVLTGDDGSDRFIFIGTDFGQDVITDFKANDKIVFKSNATSISDIGFNKLILKDSLKNETTESLVLKIGNNAVILNNWFKSGETTLNIEIDGQLISQSAISTMLQNLELLGGLDNVAVGNELIENDKSNVINVLELKSQEEQASTISQVEGFGGNDILTGGMSVVARGGKNIINGGYGDDIIKGNGEYNELNGGHGNDTITGSDIVKPNSKEIIHGGDGDDLIKQGGIHGYGSMGVDGINFTVYEGTGNNFSIYGDEGNDTISLNNILARNIEIIDGGTGVDTLDLSTLNQTSVYRLSTDEHVVRQPYGIDFRMNENKYYIQCYETGSPYVTNYEVNVQNFENIIGSIYIDTLYGNDGDNIIKGGEQSDTVSGKNGNDIVFGDNGDDSLLDYQGNDVLVGGQGADMFFFLDGNLGHNVIADFNREDSIYFNNNISSINDLEFKKVVERTSSGQEISSLELRTRNNESILIQNWYNSGQNASDINMYIGNKVDSGTLQNLIQNAQVVNAPQAGTPVFDMASNLGI